MTTTSKRENEGAPVGWQPLRVWRDQDPRARIVVVSSVALLLAVDTLALGAAWQTWFIIAAASTVASCGMAHPLSYLLARILGPAEARLIERDGKAEFRFPFGRLRPGDILSVCEVGPAGSRALHLCTTAGHTLRVTGPPDELARLHRCMASQMNKLAIPLYFSRLGIVISARFFVIACAVALLGTPLLIRFAPEAVLYGWAVAWSSSSLPIALVAIFGHLSARRPLWLTCDEEGVTLSRDGQTLGALPWRAVDGLAVTWQGSRPRVELWAAGKHAISGRVALAAIDGRGGLARRDLPLFLQALEGYASRARRGGLYR